MQKNQFPKQGSLVTAISAECELRALLFMFMPKQIQQRATTLLSQMGGGYCDHARFLVAKFKSLSDSAPSLVGMRAPHQQP